MTEKALVNNLYDSQNKSIFVLILDLHGNETRLSIAQLYHSHKKRKDSLETRAKPAVFSL